MNAPFPLNPTVGEFFGNWVWNGVRWVCTPAAGVRVVTQVFRQSGVYMPSSGLVSAIVKCIAGGGGGGAAINAEESGSLFVIVTGGGGGSGESATKTLAASLVLGGVQVTIGAGGAGSTGTVPSGNGGATTFGALCTAAGGFGANDMNAGVSYGEPGLGGGTINAGIGDYGFRGATGERGQNQTSTAHMSIGASGGLGGTLFGGNVGANAQPGIITPGGNAYPAGGAGGTGGCVNQINGTAAGGSGGSGLCVVDEYCWADSGSGDDCTGTVNARVTIEGDQWGGQRGAPPHPEQWTDD